jgi:hypothetical protein
MLVVPLARLAGRTVRRHLGRRLGVEDAAAWAIRLPLVTLVVAGVLALPLVRAR